jgi:2-oxoglutarate dehydrogenase E1 component
VEAEGFEKYLHTRYVGHKRFSLEGAETTIPVLATILTEAAKARSPEAVIGMPHRGRLNVFANIIGTPLAKILSGFEEIPDPLSIQGSGDVRYHLGASGEFHGAEGSGIFVSIAPNPSHLEWVNPVVEGIVRAKQDRRGDVMRNSVLPILIHGDAAFAGQVLSGKPSICRCFTAIAREAPSISLSTTRSVLPPRPKKPGPLPTLRTLPDPYRRRFLRQWR